MKPANLLLILCDEHNPRVLGCAGHPMIRTPNLDRLAASSVRFNNAYCNSPICVPSRAALATGRYVHRIRFWDNAIPYDGSVPTIGIGGNRIQYAKRDYYRAFAQRSKWVREHLIFDGEIARFETTLVEEWQPRFQQMCDAHAQEGPDVAALRHAGQELYQWVENEARFPFRSLTARFLNVGSYHILANELRVGWHRDFTVPVRRGKLKR